MVTDSDAPSEMVVFARKFREARKGQGLTQLAVSAQIGMDKKHISAIERCSTNPTIAVLSRLAAAVDHRLCDLICADATHAHAAAATD